MWLCIKYMSMCVLMYVCVFTVCVHESAGLCVGVFAKVYVWSQRTRKDFHSGVLAFLPTFDWVGISWLQC